MNTKAIKAPVQVPHDKGPGELFFVDIAASTVMVMYTGGDFYRNFCELHGLELRAEDHCPVCNSSNIEKLPDGTVIVEAKMWTPFPWDTYVHCHDCDAVCSIVRPPKKLLEFLYTYCYPNSVNKEPRFFTAFGKEAKITNKSVVDLGGGTGDLKEYCTKEYTNIDMHSKADLRINIDGLDDNALNELSSIKKVDVVVCCDLIEHVLIPENIFKISHQVLKSKGELYLNVGQFHDEKNLYPFHPPHITSFTRRTIEKLATSQGFSIKKQIKNSFILEKK